MIRKIAAALACIAWAMWFGGLASLFLFVTVLFNQDRETALKAAPRMFLAFERYQMLLAAAALVGAVSWRVLAKSIRVTVLFWMLAAATVPAALGPIFITRPMDELRLRGETSSPQFKKLHGESMIVYCGEILILLAAGVTLPWAMRERKTDMDQANLDELIETALQHHTAGRVAEAEQMYRRILEQDPNDADALHLLGALIAERGEGETALALIDRAISIDREVPEFHNNKGLIESSLGRFSDAIAAHQEAVRLRPDYAEAFNNLGNALLKSGQVSEATAAFRQTLALRPDYVNAHSNLGVALHKQNQYEEAIAEYRLALAAHPNHPEARNNLGVALREIGRMHEAIEAYRAAIAADDQFVDGHTNLGAALHDIGKPEEAIRSFQRAIELNPQYPPAHYNLALSLLQNGDYEQGWTEYEFRAHAMNSRRLLSGPQWAGEPLAGKTILLHGEGGFGEPLQFVRFVPIIKARGARVILQVQKDLIRLMAGVEGVDLVIAKEDQPPSYDFHCPLLSVPKILGITPQNIPSRPYLFADPKISQKWAAKFAGEKHRRIGLAWAGAPVHHNNKNRSMPLEQFAPFADVPDVRFFSLQKHHPAGHQVDFEIVEWSADLTDFAETAGLIENLDLVITVDTAVGHLSGAMGKRTWLLLPFVADWRWLRQRIDTPWYPMIRLFRQKTAGDWKSVIAEVTQLLKAG